MRFAQSGFNVAFANDPYEIYARMRALIAYGIRRM